MYVSWLSSFLVVLLFHSDMTKLKCLFHSRVVPFDVFTHILPQQQLLSRCSYFSFCCYCKEFEIQCISFGHFSIHSMAGELGKLSSYWPNRMPAAAAFSSWLLSIRSSIRRGSQSLISGGDSHPAANSFVWHHLFSQQLQQGTQLSEQAETCHVEYKMAFSFANNRCVIQKKKDYLLSTTFSVQ